MSFSPAFKGASPRVNNHATGIENGNKLGNRPVVRQSKLYRERESGNAMKSLFGQDHLSWKTNEQQGVFQGQGVYDAKTEDQTQQSPPRATGADPSSMAGADQQCEEIEYPLPGSVASCDACGNVVQRYYHCQDCLEHVGGLFDLCTECCVRVSPPVLAVPSHDALRKAAPDGDAFRGPPLSCLHRLRSTLSKARRKRLRGCSFRVTQRTSTPRTGWCM